MKEVVLVTQPEYLKAEHFFGEQRGVEVVVSPDDETSLAQAVRSHECRAVIVGVQPYRCPLYEALNEAGGSKGSVIARFGVGYDSINMCLARQHAVVVTNTPAALDRSVAEHTMWLIGSLARHVATCHLSMTSGDFTPCTGVELRGRTLGILGFGSIGRQVASIAHFGFGMRVLAADRLSPEELQQREGTDIDQVKHQFGLDEYLTDVDRVFREADVLSIHLPAVEATRYFVNADRLANMKPSSLLVNTARGSVLDEDSLVDALSSGRLAGAALDVYQHEPYRPQSAGRDLRALPNVVLTPHIGSNTVEANEAMARAALENVTNFLRGRLSKLNRVDITSPADPRIGI